MPQPEVDAPIGLATTIAPGEVGKVSLKATPASWSSGLGLSMVKVNVELPPVSIGFGLKSLEMLGGEMAVMVSLADPPGPVFVPVSVAEMNPLTLRCGPEVVTVTVTGITQFAPPANDPPVKAIVLGEVVDREPPQVTLGPEVATVTPAGNVSENAIPLSDSVEFGLVTVKLRVEVSLTATGSGEKSFVIVGGLGMPQPVNETLSMFRSAPLLGVFAP